MASTDEPILTAGETCWTVEKAARATVLIDAAAYFGTLRQALLKAKSSIFIIGWDVDSRTCLVGPSGQSDDGLPNELGPFLTALVERRPTVEVRILLWDYSMLYAAEREPLSSINLAWKTPQQISVCLDDVLPVGASHHQKLVVIDDELAFLGGIDLTIRRWDTPKHEMHNDLRRSPSGEPYRPFHDIQMMVDGDAARALAKLAHERWQNAACETVAKPESNDDPWPETVAPDFCDVSIGIARTVASYDDQPEIREIEALYIRAISNAERSIYIENQFLSAHDVARALAARMREKRDLEALIVGPNVHRGWLEERSMVAGQRRFIETLRQAGIGDRVRLVYPAIPDDDTGEGVMVHAKFMTVDDKFLRIGSANLNNRSMGFDTECDLALEAQNDAQRDGIRLVRNRLLSEHLGVSEDDIAAAIAKKKSLLQVMESLSGKERSLHPIDLSDAPNDELSKIMSGLSDPERPIPTPSFAGDLFGGTVIKGSPVRLIKLLAFVSIAIGIVALWRLTPLSELLAPEALLSALEGLRQESWAPTIIPFIFVLAGLVMFPVTALIAVMGMIFPPFTALLYSLAGSLLSAIVVFLIGANVGRGRLRATIGPRVNRISRALASQGVISVMVLRLMPVAPFSLVNLVCGASHIRFIDYVVGTFLGMAPGILLLSTVGQQLKATLGDPNLLELLLFALCIFGWLIASIMLQFIATRLRRRRDG